MAELSCSSNTPHIFLFYWFNICQNKIYLRRTVGCADLCTVPQICNCVDKSMIKLFQWCKIHIVRHFFVCFGLVHFFFHVQVMAIKTERKFYDLLRETYGSGVKPQQTFEWCKNKNLLPFDFCIEEFKIIIELDGLQHFKQVSNWQSPETIQSTDKYKMRLANKHGYSVIRIFQPDYFFFG